MNSFIELEDGYLTNQPLISVGQGRARKRIPDPDRPPTEAWLFVYRCVRGKRGIKRSRSLEVLRGETTAALHKKLRAFCERDDVVVIEEQQEPLRHMSYRGEPKPKAKSA